MKISNKLFNEQQLGQFSNNMEKIQKIQDKISSGKKELAMELTGKFEDQMRKLPWPVNTGFISLKFGLQRDLILKNVQPAKLSKKEEESEDNAEVEEDNRENDAEPEEEPDEAA